MKKLFVLLLALAMLFSATAMAQTVTFDDYGFAITLPDGWGYEATELTQEYVEAGVVYGIDAHAQDKSIDMWVEIRAFDEESRSATEVTVTEFEGYVSDWREYFPDMSLFAVKGIPFIIYTETDEDGAYLTAYTWTASHEFGFVFFAEKLTDEVRQVMEDIIKTYTAM